MIETVLLTHAAATWFMVGLIWFVQVVHYPLFTGVGEDGWARYSRRHRSLTTLVVAPMMLAELTCTILLVVSRPGALTVTGTVLLALTWTSTFSVQVPLHGRLGRGHNTGVVRTLVATNWARTIFWSIRGVIALLLLSAS